MNNDAPDYWLSRLLESIQRDIADMRKENGTQHAEMRKQVGDLDTKVSAVLNDTVELKQWRDGHNQHHGANDSAIKLRIDGIEGADRDEKNVDKGRQEANQQWRRRDLMILGGIWGAVALGIDKIDLIWKLVK